MIPKFSGLIQFENLVMRFNLWLNCPYVNVKYIKEMGGT